MDGAESNSNISIHFLFSGIRLDCGQGYLHQNQQRVFEPSFSWFDFVQKWWFEIFGLVPRIIRKCCVCSQWRFEIQRSWPTPFRKPFTIGRTHCQMEEMQHKEPIHQTSVSLFLRSFDYDFHHTWMAQNIMFLSIFVFFMQMPSKQWWYHRQILFSICPQSWRYWCQNCRSILCSNGTTIIHWIKSVWKKKKKVITIDYLAALTQSYNFWGMCIKFILKWTWISSKISPIQFIGKKRMFVFISK